MCFAKANLMFLQESAVIALCKKEFSDEEEQSNYLIYLSAQDDSLLAET